MIYDFGLRLETDNDVVIFFFLFFSYFLFCLEYPLLLLFVVVVCFVCHQFSLSFNIFFVPFDLRSSFFFEDFY